MSDQVTLPPGITSARDWQRQGIGLSDVESIQRDAVMAERRHVASQIDKPMDFSTALRHLLNCYSAEHASNTPDFVLAGYLQRCLENWNATNRAREKHFERSQFPSLQQILADKVLERASNRGEILPKAYDSCNCTGPVAYYFCRGTKCCFHCNKPLREQV